MLVCYLKNKKRNNLNRFLLATNKSKVARSPFEWKKTLAFLVFLLEVCNLPSIKEQKSTPLQNWNFFFGTKKLKVLPRKLQSVLLLFCSGTMKKQFAPWEQNKVSSENFKQNKQAKTTWEQKETRKKKRARTRCRQRKVFFWSSRGE